MVTIEKFEIMVAEITQTLPADFFRELNGGIIIREERKIHPESVGEQLSIMGEYQRHRHLGRSIVIYYGSFMAVCGHYSESQLCARLRKTILHEFRHHLESLAGEKDLEIEDAIQIAKYKSLK